MSQINLLICGEGGQGIQTIAKAILDTANLSDNFISYIPSFGVEQRGTPSIAFLIISDKPVLYPKFNSADICVILQQRAIDSVVKYINPNTTVLFDSSTVLHTKIPKIAAKKLGLPATKYAREKFSPRSYNVIIYGAISKMTALNSDQAEETIISVLSGKLKDKKLEESYRQAFKFGYEAVLETGKYSFALYQTKTEINIIRDQNKTAEIDPNLCKGCGICILKCPVKALQFGEESGVFALPVPTIDIAKCIACGNCRRFCPDGAIGVDKK